jgi:hypothetical protein
VLPVPRLADAGIVVGDFTVAVAMECAEVEKNLAGRRVWHLPPSLQLRLSVG